MELSAGFGVAAGGQGGGIEVEQGGAGSGGGDGPERLWKYKDVSEYLGMSIPWVRRMVTMRRIEGVRKLGRATRFIPSEVKRWAMSQPVGC